MRREDRFAPHGKNGGAAAVRAALDNIRPNIEKRVSARTGIMPLPSGRRLRRLLAPYETPDYRLAGAEFLCSLLGFVICVGSVRFAEAHAVWPLLLLILPGAGFIVRLFVIQHDCSHRSFLPWRHSNDWLGRAISLVTLTPHAAWRGHHLAHHATVGNLDRRGVGDFPMLTANEYAARTRSQRLFYRIYRHPIVLFGVGPIIQFVILYRFGGKPSGWRAARSAVLTNAALAVEVWLLHASVGLLPLLAALLPMQILAASLGAWLMYIQHHFAGTTWRRGRGWRADPAAARASSFYDLPRVLHWFTLNVGIHHIHHLSPRVPCYRLYRCAAENPALRAAAVNVRLRESLGHAWLALWDEERGELVSIAAAERRLRPQTAY
jgi:acyl-lipid omega-6 desaturase (Delta-12 desaturase)